MTAHLPFLTLTTRRPRRLCGYTAGEWLAGMCGAALLLFILTSARDLCLKAEEG